MLINFKLCGITLIKRLLCTVTVQLHKAKLLQSVSST
jgi:hypothetical protein